MPTRLRLYATAAAANVAAAGHNLELRHSMIVEKFVTNLPAKFNYDGLRNEKVLGNWKSDNNKSQEEQQQLEHC